MENFIPGLKSNLVSNTQNNCIRDHTIPFLLIIHPKFQVILSLILCLTVVTSISSDSAKWI